MSRRSRRSASSSGSGSRQTLLLLPRCAPCTAATCAAAALQLRAMATFWSVLLRGWCRWLVLRLRRDNTIAHMPSEDEKLESRIGGYRKRADGQPRVNKTKVTANRAGMHQPIRDNPAMAAARAMFEGTPGATCQSVADESGIPVGTVRRWKAQYGWKSAARTIPDLAGRAGQLANTFKVKMTELGKPLSDDAAAAEVAREVSTQHAVEVRAAVLDRHRKEWSAPRKLAYEAIQQAGRGDVAGGFEKAKLAKITAETLQIVQVGECRAFGLNHDARGSDGGTVVVIEREQATDLPGEPTAELPSPEPIGGGTTATPDGKDF